MLMSRQLTFCHSIKKLLLLRTGGAYAPPVLLVPKRTILRQVVGGLPVIADVRLVAEQMQALLIIAARGDDGEKVFGIAGGLYFVRAVAVDHIKGVGQHTLNGLTL